MNPENTLFTGINVLVIDENKVSLCVFEKYFRKWEVAYQTAKTAKEALKKIKENEFQLVLIEAQLPDSPGCKLLKEIQEKQPNAPIYLLQDSSHTANTGCNGYHGILDRPIKEEVLFKHLSFQAQKINLETIENKKSPY